MPIPLNHRDPEELLSAERDIRATLGDRTLDFEAMLAVSNIYRAANAVRNRMEKEVLGPAGLTWGGFTILFVLWVWGEREAGDLAEDCGLAKGTLSGMLTTLEKSDFIQRTKHSEDGRKVVVSLLSEGERTIERVFPTFNAFEARFTERLEPDEVSEMARLLRIVTSTAADSPLVT
jgi:MarR family transcriptional regulator, organic hydroperoxide resistance regulator